MQEEDTPCTNDDYLKTAVEEEEVVSNSNIVVDRIEEEEKKEVATGENSKSEVVSPVIKAVRTAAPLLAFTYRKETGRILLEERKTSFNPELEFQRRVERERKRREKGAREFEKAEKAMNLLKASTAIMAERQRQMKYEAAARARRLNIRNPIRNTKFGERMKVQLPGLTTITRTIGVITR